MKKLVAILKYSLKYEIWHYGVIRGTISFLIIILMEMFLASCIFSPLLILFFDDNTPTLTYYVLGFYSVSGIIGLPMSLRSFKESATSQKILDSITSGSLDVSFADNISQELGKIKNYIDDFTIHFERKKNEINEIEKIVQELNKQIENQTEVKKLLDIDKNKIAEALFSNSYYKRKEMRSLFLGFVFGVLSSLIASIMLKLL